MLQKGCSRKKAEAKPDHCTENEQAEDTAHANRYAEITIAELMKVTVLLQSFLKSSSHVLASRASELYEGAEERFLPFLQNEIILSCFL